MKGETLIRKGESLGYGCSQFRWKPVERKYGALGSVDGGGLRGEHFGGGKTTGGVGQEGGGTGGRGLTGREAGGHHPV